MLLNKKEMILGQSMLVNFQDPFLFLFLRNKNTNFELGTDHAAKNPFYSAHLQLSMNM